MRKTGSFRRLGLELRSPWPRDLDFMPEGGGAPMQIFINNPADRFEFCSGLYHL